MKEFIKESIDEKKRLVRSERYALQSVSKKALPGERVSICLRNRIPNKAEQTYEDIKIWQHNKTGKAFLSGLAVCGSVWTCPVCAAKISERRKMELKKAFDMFQSERGKIAMLTLTFAHNRFDSLEDLLDKFGQATNKFMSGKAYNNIRLEMGIVGRVRASECTYGDNGFHPHTHIAIFYKNECDLERMRIQMYRLWEKACSKFDLKTSFDYGLDLQNADRAEEYFTKHGTWSIEQEMTKWHTKKGKKESLTPYDFLRLYLSTEDEKYLRLFKEYATAYKGKRQLQWSQGLKKMFVLEDKSDEEVAKEKLEDADLLGLIEYFDWKHILKYDLRSKLLDNIEMYGYDLGLKITLATKKESSRHEDSQTNEI